MLAKLEIKEEKGIERLSSHASYVLYIYGRQKKTAALYYFHAYVRGEMKKGVYMQLYLCVDQPLPSVQCLWITFYIIYTYLYIGIDLYLSSLALETTNKRGRSNPTTLVRTREKRFNKGNHVLLERQTDSDVHAMWRIVTAHAHTHTYSHYPHTVPCPCGHATTQAAS
jgi:hypothetical protein